MNEYLTEFVEYFNTGIDLAGIQAAADATGALPAFVTYRHDGEQFAPDRLIMRDPSIDVPTIVRTLKHTIVASRIVLLISVTQTKLDHPDDIGLPRAVLELTNTSQHGWIVFDVQPDAVESVIILQDGEIQDLGPHTDDRASITALMLQRLLTGGPT